MNSTADRALVHDNDLLGIFQVRQVSDSSYFLPHLNNLTQDNPEKDAHDFRSWIHNLCPQIYVDENGMDLFRSFLFFSV
jgi:hypothetical protein